MWTGVILSAMVIFGFWLWSINDLFFQTQRAAILPADEELSQSLSQFKKDVPTLWQSLGAGISNVINSFGEVNSQPTTQPAASDAAPSYSGLPGEERLPLE